MRRILIAIGVSIAVFACSIIFLLVLMGSFAQSTLNSNISVPRNMFTSLSSFDVLEKYELNTNGISDPDLPGLKVKDSYISEVEYHNNKYTVYAYIFQSDKDAQTYYARVTGGQRSEFPGLYYVFTSNYSETIACAYYENCAYKIEGIGYKKFCEFATWLIEDFPINIREKHYEEYGEWLPE